MVRQPRLLKLTLIEWVVVALILTILIALLNPQTQWASDGSIRLPVRVFVFDAVRRTPIQDAQVMVFRCPLVSDPNSLAEARERFDPDHINELTQEYWKATDADGSATVEHEFYTGANHVRPITHAHLDYAWVRVESKGFGGATIPVRHESQPTSDLRKQGEIVVQIGLIPEK